MRAIFLTFLFVLAWIAPAHAIATITAATVGTFLLKTAVAAGLSWGANYLIDKFRDKDDDKGTQAGSGLPSLQELRTSAGEVPMSHVLGRERLTPQDYLIAFVGKSDLGNARRGLDHIHVLSEGPCMGIEKIWVDGFLCMEAPKDQNGNYVLNGDIQYLEPSGTGWQDEYRKLRDERIAELRVSDPGLSGADTHRAASVYAISQLDEMDRFRFRAIQRVRRKDGGERAGSVSAEGTGGDNVFVADWGGWCRAWVYPVDGFRNLAGNEVLTHQNSSKLADNPKWKQADYKFRNKCIVHIQFEKSNFDSPFSSVFPRVEYQIKGKKITWPGQATAVWTENSAAIRYWHHTELEEIPPSKIDTTEFTEAYNKCEEEITLSVPEDTENEFTKTVKRYSTNMQFLHDPNNFEQYTTDMDMAWQGAVVDHLGKLFFRPGFERAPSFSIGPQNIVKNGIGEFRAQPPINERVNAVQTVIQSSFDHDFESIALGPVVNTAAETRDGRYLERKIQALRAVKYPVNAYNIMHIFLRRAIFNGRLPVRIQVSPVDFEGNDTYPEIKPMDRCTVNEPTLGLTNAIYEVDRRHREEDWTLSLDLKESPNGIYADTAQLPPPMNRNLVPPLRTDPASPLVGLAATANAVISEDGKLQASIGLSWTANDEAVEFVIVKTDNTFTTTAIAQSGESSLTVMVPDSGDYQVFGRHVNEFARRSAPAIANVSITLAHLKPATPFLTNQDSRGDILTLFFRPYASTDYHVVGIDLRYRLRALDDTTPFPPTPSDAVFDTLPTFVREPVIPTAAGQDWSAIVPVPENGRYRIYARAVTLLGVHSDIVDLGPFVLEGARPGILTTDFEPEWSGTLQNLGMLWSDEYVADDGQTKDIANALVRNRNSVSGLSRNDWNGRNGWPFSYSSPSVFTGTPIELGTTGNYNVRYEVKTHVPSGSSATPSFTVTFQGKLNGTNVGAPVAAGDGSAFVRMNGINQLQPIVRFNSNDTALEALRVFTVVVV